MKVIIVSKLSPHKSSFMMYGRYTLRFQKTEDCIYIERREISDLGYQKGVQELIDRVVKLYCGKK